MTWGSMRFELPHPPSAAPPKRTRNSAPAECGRPLPPLASDDRHRRPWAGSRPSEQGFDTMQQSLHRVLDVIDSPALDDKWHCVSRYLDDFAKEAQQKKVFEERLSSIVVGSNAAASCHALSQLLALLSETKVAAGKLSQDIQHSVFGYIFPEGKPGSLVTYKDLLSQAEARIADATGASVLVRAVRTWQSAYLGKVFLAWRYGFRHRRAARTVARKEKALASLCQELTSKIEHLEAENTRLLGELKAVSASQRSREAQHTLECRNLRETIETLREECAGGKQEIVALQAKHEDDRRFLIDEQRRLRAELEETYKMVCEMKTISDTASLPANIQRWQDDAVYLVDNLKQTQGSAVLLHWLKEVSGSQKLGDTFCDPEPELRAMVVASMQIVSGMSVDSASLLDEFDALVGSRGKAEFALDHLKRYGVECWVTADRLVFDDSARMVLCATMMRHLLTSAQPFRPVKPLEQPSPVRRIRLQECWEAVSGLVQRELTDQQEKPLPQPVLSPGERRDRRSFTEIDPLRMEGVADDTTDVEPVERVLAAHYKRIRCIYKYYCSSDTAVDTKLTRNEFMQMLRDCKLNHVEGRKNRRRATLGGNTALFQGEPAKECLSPEDFVHALVRIAAEKGGRCADMSALSAKLEVFITRHIIPNANFVCVDGFTKDLAREEVRGVLSEYQPYLRKLFAAYAASDPGQGTKEKELLSWREFKRLMNDVKAVDEVCTHYALQQLYLKLQIDSQESDKEDAPSMDFDRFIVAVCAVAAFKNPAPYLPLQNKVKRLMQVWVIPGLAKKIRWD